MNFHSDEWIMDSLKEHYQEALEYFQEDRIVGLFLQGSQNYGLDYEGSDIDTKLIVVPTFKDIAMNKKPVSATHICANDEHIDWKDIRLYIQIFKKQNINFVEILFTPYKILNPIYEKQWNRLIKSREDIARYFPIQSIKSMRGVAKEKYFALEHHYPSRMKWIDKFGYDPKQLHHLLRIEEFIERYINRVQYKKCLISENPEYLVDVKKGLYNLEDARVYANGAIEHIDLLYNDFLKNEHTVNTNIDILLDDVQYEIMKIAIQKEIG